MWWVLQMATALILVLAANTAFADFPRLGFFLAYAHRIPSVEKGWRPSVWVYHAYVSAQHIDERRQCFDACQAEEPPSAVEWSPSRTLPYPDRDGCGI